MQYTDTLQTRKPSSEVQLEGGAVYEEYARAGKPVGLPESVVTSGKFQNGV